ncbi:DNA mismatch repair protein MSH1, mitochondrial isoform X1 [Cucurbita moschata]|uniref:DNA mismatch repair protein MSH1, mitochondrial isoform X1 n=1 Tax=Cucurbita moschata TaxID=3662 RepID=A0A6J1ECS8_CUCMO|nr:DNA mismatch repair protein MSH1, mitochondrial isoform X1 [Cucurbita moschata]XP_022924549.1 DNA mismatch repair protein MSH1, mitochondrial isoform X1 [Cucurbita moschata]
MYWVATRNVVSFSRWRFLALLIGFPPRNFTPFTHSPAFLNSERQQLEKLQFGKGRKYSGGSIKAAKKFKDINNVQDDKFLSHISWWKEMVESCKKPSSVQLVKRLDFSNLLGLDINLKNGSLKEGTLNWEILQFKAKFPREVLLCRVGDFYEAIGIDACILVEYAGLNPFGGQRMDSVPKAGCPVVNLRQTLDDLTRNGFSVCIVEEVQGPMQARSRKGRFISGHAHPGSPYVFGLVGVDHDLDFPEPMPVVGISRSARGYCISLVIETMKTYSSEDGLTEEALVTKLRTCQYHHLFLHTSLRNNSSGTCRWGEFGEGGRLWGECNSRHFEWFDGNPLTNLLSKVKDLYGLDDEVTFRNVTISSENRPHPLTLGTATQIGAIPTEGIPCLLKVLLPSNCAGLPALYIRDLLLNPPAYEIATTIQATCRLMSNVTCAIPDFTCFPPAKLVKLLEMREANHIEFCRMKNVLDEILHMHKNCELSNILKLLMDPSSVATGLKIDYDTFVDKCEWASSRVGEMIFLDNESESDQKINSYFIIPNDFFEDMESSWKGRVKRIHIEEVCTEVESAAEALSLAVTEDFVPIISRIKATTAPLGGPKGEILYARDNQSVWFKGRRFAPAVWAGSPGEEEIKQLKPALDSKGKKVGDEWFTTKKVEDALTRYQEANAKAKARVVDLLRQLSSELLAKMNVLIFASMLLIIAKALFAHVSEGRRRKWVFPTLAAPSDRSKQGRKSMEGKVGMKLVGLSPYWFDVIEGNAVQNSIEMESLFLLTGPNGGGKSSLLRSICAAALLGICGFMVPAESALIPHFDSIMLHMKSFDSPADGKSSFQVEMSEMRSIMSRATESSLVLIDEICRGTETAKGTCIAGSIVEALDKVGCLGIVSTHLHGIFNLPLDINNTVFKAMGTVCTDGRTVPTWKLIGGICRESLAFETAKNEGICEAIIHRAQDLYLSNYVEQGISGKQKMNLYPSNSSHARLNGNDKPHLLSNGVTVEAERPKTEKTKKKVVSWKEIEGAITAICQKKLIEFHKDKNTLKPAEIQCVLIDAREKPPPSTVGASSVYVILRPDGKFYVGQTDDLEGRVHSHRLKEGMRDAAFLYFIVPGKSLACQLETLLINRLPDHGLQLTNVADGKHRNFGTSNLLSENVTVCS